MSNFVETPQCRCKAGFAQADITPPVGIYHRMWGAALHDRATGVHRPLMATAMFMESLDGANRLLVLGLDHCILDGVEIASIRQRIRRAVDCQVMVALSHTHGSGWMSRSRSDLPGGDLIGPYLEQLSDCCERIALESLGSARQAAIVYQYGRCDLARHRDFYDAARKRYVCGFNPLGKADDTLLVAKVVAQENEQVLGTVVNYACHPTTLAWENTLISPDYVGALREVVETATEAPCLFLQGASGDLGPQEGFVGDVRVADKNGRRVGFAALATLEAIPPPATRFDYRGPVVSGAVLGIWQHVPADEVANTRAVQWKSAETMIPLPYRAELPTVAATKAELNKWQSEESAARQANDVQRLSECRAQGEQMTRQLARLAALPTGATYPYRVNLFRLGDSIWIFCPGELYQDFQITLRAHFPRAAIVVATISNDWQPGYLPAEPSYGHGIYQDVIAAVAPGSLEAVIESVTRQIHAWLE